ncbi:uncharacterized protein ACR2FA_003316 [Aphomia sociella]
MAGKSVSFNTYCNLYDSHLESLAKWLSCNGEVWGMGPTAVFASAAALFLYNELEATIFIPGDHVHVALLEKTLISTMVLGMLALMIHLWVCCMRFFQYYLDTLIKDSPNMLLEMTTAGLLGGQGDMVPLGPLTRFLRQQQPQIHITVCWFLSLCYADYVRKHYCQRFNMPFLEQWQAELHERAARGVHRTMEKVQSFVSCVHQRLRVYTQPQTNSEIHTVRARRLRERRWMSAEPQVRCRGAMQPAVAATRCSPADDQTKTSACDPSASRAKQLLMRLRSFEPISNLHDVRAAVHRTPASVVLTEQHLLTQRNHEDLPWRNMAVLPFE